MKNLLLSAIISLYFLPCWGQTKSETMIALAVVTPHQTDHLDESQSVRLEKKIVELVSKSGLSASKGGSNVIIYPVFSIENEELVEGGMQNITVIQANISLFIKQFDNDIIFASVSKQIKGSGSSKQKAINDIITKISVNDVKFGQFIQEGKAKIIDYYETNCSTILAKAETCSKRKEHEEAIALLMSVPEAVSCYSEALKKADMVYQAYQNQRCNELLQQAQSLYGGHQYMDALSVLSELEVFSTQCSSDAKVLIKTIEGKISAQEKQEWDFKVKQYNDRLRFEEKQQNNKARLTEKWINAARNIAVSYYNRKVNYNYVYHCL
ncbi:MAG: hypothetical protein LBR26_17295 [Prevotella sp.]|jgi:hypothetical protein|nr:hypothetical protein [Prevotella sp.]